MDVEEDITTLPSVTQNSLWQKRREFFVRLLAWGVVTERTRLIMVGVEDGGQSWVDGNCFWKVDEKIDRCLSGAKGLGRPDFVTVPGHYILPGGGPSDYGRTEEIQCEIAVRLRERIFGRNIAQNITAESHYYPSFLRSFELCANLHPFSRPTTGHSYTRQFLNYLGYSKANELMKLVADTLDFRKKGIRALVDAVKTKATHENADSPVMVLFMGKVLKEEMENDLLPPGVPNDDDYELPLTRHTARCVRRANIIYCFANHPSNRNGEGLVKEDGVLLADQLAKRLTT